MKLLRFAAIDIGSNAVRLLIASVLDEDGNRRPKKNCMLRLPIRLGADVFTEGKISDENILMLTEAMKSYRHVMNVYKPISYRACATSAMRDAENGNLTVRRIFEKSGIKIEIIDGAEEAEIIYSNGLMGFLNPENEYLYVDVGGGSTELSYFKDGERKKSKSFNVGTIRMLNNGVSPETFVEMKAWLQEIKHDAGKLIGIGSGGNINKIHKMTRFKNQHSLSLEKLTQLHKEVSTLSYEDRIRKLDLNPDRADVIVPAAEIFLKVLKWSKVKEIYAPRIGLSDGIITNLFTQYQLNGPPKDKFGL